MTIPRLITVVCLSFLANTISSAQETTTFSYDALGRLVSSSHSGGPADGVLSNYNFDAASNRTHLTVIVPTINVDNAATNQANSPMSFGIYRTGSLAKAAKITYQTRDGSARAGIEYSSVSGEVVFQPGEYQKTVTVPIIASPQFSGYRAFNLDTQVVFGGVLSNPQPYGNILGGAASGCGGGGGSAAKSNMKNQPPQTNIFYCPPD